MKLNLGCGDKPLIGFDNLDKETGWTWEAGLPYDDETVEAITISHTLMYVEDRHMAYIFKELYRVLKIDVVVRITEDATDDPLSMRYNGHPEAVSMTSQEKTVCLMIQAGFRKLAVCSADNTMYKNSELLQDYHGGRPKVFFVEGQK